MPTKITILKASCTDAIMTETIIYVKHNRKSFWKKKVMTSRNFCALLKYIVLEYYPTMFFASQLAVSIEGYKRCFWGNFNRLIGQEPAAIGFQNYFWMKLNTHGFNQLN